MIQTFLPHRNKMFTFYQDQGWQHMLKKSSTFGQNQLRNTKNIYQQNP